MGRNLHLLFCLGARICLRFIVRSLDNVLRDDQDAPLSGIDDPQQGRSGVRSDSGAEVFQTLQPKAHHDKGNWPPGEGCECLAQVRFCLCPTGDAGDVAGRCREEISRKCGGCSRRVHRRFRQHRGSQP